VTAGNGGAIAIASAAVALENCTFTDNQGMFGGAIALQESATLYAGGWVGLLHAGTDRVGACFEAWLRARHAQQQGVGTLPVQGAGAWLRLALCRSVPFLQETDAACSACLPCVFQLTARTAVTMRWCWVTTSTWTIQVGARSSPSAVVKTLDAQSLLWLPSSGRYHSGLASRGALHG
jgi:hypothetical protein